LLVADHVGGEPRFALAQTSATVSGASGPNAMDADARRVINYQGQVYNPTGGAPYANAGLNFSFRLYNNPAGTNQVFREDLHIVTNADGFFSAQVGITGGFNNVNSIFNGQELYLRVYINEQELSPLQPITFVPYAFWAVHAGELEGYKAADFTKIVSYGVVNADGSRKSGHNFNSSIQNVAGANVLVIDIGGINHSVDDYTTIITPACASPAITGIGTSQGDLVVDIWDQSGNRIQCTIQFMTMER
jgi:hypothetical protein